MRHSSLGLITILLCALWAGIAWSDENDQFRADIQAQPLATALQQFAKQAGVEIVFFTEIAAGHTTPPLHGVMTRQNALNVLLEGCGLTYRQVNPRTIEIRRARTADDGNSAGERLHRTKSPAVTDASPTRPENALAEIVVTATRRKQSIDTVPLSIVALTAAQLTLSGVKGFSDVAMLTPGIELDNLGGPAGSTLTNVSIRGVDSQIGASTTGIYIDDTPIQSRINPITDFGNPLPVSYDLDRVEVARGPQGTLFGAGAEGGTIRFITPQASLTSVSGRTTAEYDVTSRGDPSYEAGAIWDGPLIFDKLGAHISAWFRRDGGYVDRLNPLTGDIIDSRANWSQSKSIRASLSIAPTEFLTITPSLNYQDIYRHDVSTIYEYLSNIDGGVFNNGFLVQQPSDDKFYLPSLRIEGHFAGADLVSVTSYFHRDASILLDLTTLLGAVGIPGPNGWGDSRGPAYPTSYTDAAPGPQGTRQNNISEELRVASPILDSRLTWVGGLFFSRATQTDFEYLSAASIPGPQPFLNGAITIQDLQTAGFGEASFKVIPRLTFTAGVRIADVRYDATQHSGGPYFAGVPPVVRGSASETPVTPKASLSLQMDAHDLFYVTAAEGYRVGGINAPIPSYCQGVAPQSYASDKTWSYEVGAKNTLADGHVHLDTSAFHIDWRNIQQDVALVSCGAAYIANAGAASINGFDFAAKLIADEHWRFDLGVAYTDAYYTRTVATDGVVFAEKDATIGNVPQVPVPWSATGAAEFDFNGLEGSNTYLRAEGIYHSKNPGPFTSSNAASVSYNTNIGPNPATALLNVRGGMTWPNLDLSLFINNALNAHPELMRAQDTPSSTLYYATTFRPRTLGVKAEWRFD